MHCTGSTYGTWLRGDPRGWRARHHREHVEGDYRAPPPPGAYDALHRPSHDLMKRPGGVRNEWHFRKVCSYIPDHAKRGAAVYSILFRKK